MADNGWIFTTEFDDICGGSSPRSTVVVARRQVQVDLPQITRTPAISKRNYRNIPEKLKYLEPFPGA